MYSPTEESEPQVPRFLVAIQRYEEFLHGLAKDHDEPDTTVRARSFSDIMTACSDLAGAAQDYDFIITVTALRGSKIRAEAGKRILQALCGSDVPEGVRAIYADLYGAELAPYADPGDNLNPKPSH